MKVLTILLCIFMCLCSATLAVELDPDKFMSVDEIKPGMKGIGKTVFEGTKIDEFQVEVLDVVENAVGPKVDVIWALCSGGPLEETGVLSGMSGSPVYIDGKLIGAVAYRLGAFVKQPIAGITPIASMLRMLENQTSNVKNQELGAGYSLKPSESLGIPAYAGIESFHDFDDLMAQRELRTPGIQYPVSSIQYPPSSIQANPASLVPIQTPVMMAGFHRRAMNDIAPVLKEFGMIPVQGSGTSSQVESEEAPLEPGAVLGVQYLKGDASIFAVGTLTYIHGDKVLAFGHPMPGMGKTSLPMAGGRVGLLVSSLMGSSKYVSPARTMGTLTYDSRYGAMGVIGKPPEFIPLKIRISSQRSSQPREYNFEVAKDRLFSADFIFMTAVNTIHSAEKSMGDYTMRTHSEINLKGYSTISKDDVFSGISPSNAAAGLVGPLYSIMHNSFEEVDVEGVLLEISFEDKQTNARIEGVQINKDRIRPGDSLELMVFLTPYMEDTVIKRFQVTVPKDTPEGRSLLRISDASSSSSWERARAPMKSRTVDLPHLIRRIREEESNSDIIVELFAPKVGVTIRDQELPALPLTAFSVMNSRKQTGGSGLTRGTTFLKQQIHTDYVISGRAMLLLNIDRDAP